jgi:putative toxin-antitoxin system antitoxin component (TIGR02293 family)
MKEFLFDLDKIRENQIPSVIGIDSSNRDELISSLKKGLPVSTIASLQEALKLSQEEIAEVINISNRTIIRRKKQGKLDTDESERVYRLARLYDQAKAFLKKDEFVERWFKTPKRALGDKIPLEYASTDPGAEAVHHLLGQLAHGVLS